GAGTLVLRGSLDRESLYLSGLTLPGAAHRLAWLADHLNDFAGSGIIYTLTVAATEQVAAFLRSRGIKAAAYSGQTEDAERRAAEDDLLANRIKALVATSALGMGFDKPDLGFVIHLGAPPSPIAYYQQVGRAGRGVERAQVVLLPGAEDEAIWRYFGSLAFPSETQVRNTLAALSASKKPLSTAALEARVDLRRTRLETLLKVLDVDGAAKRVSGGWTATGQPWHYEAERYARVAEARNAEQQAMREYSSMSGCRMEYLRRQLDDPGAAPCGRCDRCTGHLLDAAVTDESLSAAQTWLGKPGLELAPKKLWPMGMAALGVPLSGKIANPAEEGRAVARLSDVGWGSRLRTLFAAPDAPVPDEVVRAVVEVLAAWKWSERPKAIVALPSRRRPQLVASLAERIAKLGRLPLLGALVRVRNDAAEPHRSNSAQRLRRVYGAFSAKGLVLGEGPLLVVDDSSNSGWTMAEATRVLREAGSGPVLPLVLAIDG
ncbi:MAG TPA: helicase-related protein, partial [Myxococcales bacterium]|nr:helicase-related protein [Myxococcales bacterium]